MKWLILAGLLAGLLAVAYLLVSDDGAPPTTTTAATADAGARDEPFGCRADGKWYTSPAPLPVPTLGAARPLAAAERDDDACPVFALDLSVPLRVSSPTAPRAPALAAFPIPVARDLGLHSTSGLVVAAADGTILPAQFEVLSRWDAAPAACAAPIRHLFAHVAAVPSKAAPTPWRLVHAPGTPRPGGLRVETSSAAWTIETGVARFTVPRDRFVGLARAEIHDEGVPIVVSALDGTSSGFLLARDGTMSSGHAAPWRIALERSGPAVATILARGYYGDARRPRDLGYTIRLHFYANSAVVRVDATYYHGRVSGPAASEAQNLAKVERAWMRVPLSTPPDELELRADVRVLRTRADGRVRIEQRKRTPARPEPSFVAANEEVVLDSGMFARQPVLRAGPVAAMVAHLAMREPQALRWDPRERSLEIDFTSEPIEIGGARGIWSTAVIDFAAGPIAGRALQDHAERPLTGTTDLDYLNASGALGPYAREPSYRELLAEVHANTKRFYTEQRLTGLQLWPDLPVTSCTVDQQCRPGALFDDGGSHYWNWSLAPIEEALRTGDDDLLWAYAIPEALSFAETLAFRLDHDRRADSSVSGLVPCYGTSVPGSAGPPREGLNARGGSCPGDYTYNKAVRLAYLATADRRLLDYMEEAAEGAIRAFGELPAPRPSADLELSIARLSEQRLEAVLSAAEFVPDEAANRRARQAMRTYLELMLDQSLIDGHACFLGGAGVNSACALERCESTDAWMMAPPYDMLLRAASLFGHARLRAWALEHVKTALARHAVLGADGLPDMAEREARVPGDDAKNGWRTAYRCRVVDRRVDPASCEKLTNIENEGHFYDTGMLAFLNQLALSLNLSDGDPHSLCDWLPRAWKRQLSELPSYEINDKIWGKTTGLALAYVPAAAGALERCPEDPAEGYEVFEPR